LLLTGLGPLAEEVKSEADRFAGFPEIGKYRPGERTSETITSDRVEGLIRPTWTRAMGDLGGWPSMVRFKRDIFLYFPHVDGHRGTQFEATGQMLRYVSRDEGRNWSALPPESPRGRHFEFVVVGDRLYRYGYVNSQATVETSTDGVNWSKRRSVYEPRFFFWGVTWDKASDAFWVPAYALPGPGRQVDPIRQVHLLKSQDGLKWEYVSTVQANGNESESTLRFEEDRTMVVLIRQRRSGQSWVATARPPYQEWDVSNRRYDLGGQHFFEIGGKTFVPSRGFYRDEGTGRRLAFSMIYRFTEERQLQPWAVMDSMGDCSYPFLVETPTEILCAYYSQHEDAVSKTFLSGFDKKEFLRGPP
jgi:hypothetical protein